MWLSCRLQGKPDALDLFIFGLEFWNRLKASTPTAKSLPYVCQKQITVPLHMAHF